MEIKVSCKHLKINTTELRHDMKPPPNPFRPLTSSPHGHPHSILHLPHDDSRRNLRSSLCNTPPLCPGRPHPADMLLQQHSSPSLFTRCRADPYRTTNVDRFYIGVGFTGHHCPPHHRQSTTVSKSAPRYATVHPNPGALRARARAHTLRTVHGERERRAPCLLGHLVLFIGALGR